MVDYSPWDHKELDMIEQLVIQTSEYFKSSAIRKSLVSHFAVSLPASAGQNRLLKGSCN